MDSQIDGFKSDLSDRDKKIESLDSQIDGFKSELNNYKQEITLKEKNMELIKKQYNANLLSRDQDKFCIKCYKEKLSNNSLEIQYFKNNTLLKKILSPIAYIYILLKSNPKEFLLNLKLYKILKNSECFDIGYYLNQNKDIKDSKWCKYFSPELHYVCSGFNEGRNFNKKYFKKNSKEELLNNILKYDY